MASIYQQVTDPEEAWKYYEAGLLLRRVRTFNYPASVREGPKKQETCSYFEEHKVAGYADKWWVESELRRLPDVYFVLVEDD